MDIKFIDTKALYLQIYEQFRREILEGVYTAGQRLPPIRKLASDLGVARNTVEAAYRQLVQEGFVSSRTGSGYTVEDLNLNEELFSKSVDESIGAYSAHERQLIMSMQKPVCTYTYDFNYGNLEEDAFPSEVWRKLTSDALHSFEAGGASRYDDHQGDYLLRLNLVNHLRKSRGVRCFPEQVIIQAGTPAAIQSVMQLFDPAIDTVAMEEPGYQGARLAFEQCRFKITPCPIFHGSSLFIRSLARSGARLCFVTPSNQFPTGAILPMQARLQLLEWARVNEAYILEDDYCHEFRYSAHPVPSLQSLDTHHRVIYMGTFSTTFSPALRMSYVILPPELLGQWKEHFQLAHSSVPWFTQVVMRRFIEQGHWEKLVRRALMRNKQKYETLIAALQTYLGDKIALTENGAGLHVLVQTKDGRSQEELVELAGEQSVGVYETNRYWISSHPLKANHILVGFSSIKKADIEPGVQALKRAWFGE
ncbi:MAG: PLP-dependent aminotransferase family protein [Coriobacteriia bacterium]|nr:PLP-dependent aminotransferase family protein [Coriobacteriia bacterium]